MKLDEYRSHYRAKHTTTGCRLSHMFGVPVILLSIVTLLFAWKIGLVMMVSGWLMLWLGHLLFEGNRPALWSEASNPLIYLAAVLFVGEEWWHLVRHGRLSDGSDKK